jgi:hypothetical protein
MPAGNSYILIRLVRDAILQPHRLATPVPLSQLGKSDVPRTI